MLRTLLLVVLLGVSGAGFAQTFDYNYVEGYYGTIDFDDLGVDGDGFGIGGSFAVSERFHVFGEYQKADLDFGVDVSQFDLGVGFNTPISDVVDVVARLAYVSAEVDVSGLGSADEDGYGAGVGLRGMVTPQFELNGDITYVDLGSGSGDTSFGAGFLYHFSDAFAAGLSGDWDDDASMYQLTGRMSFGQ